MSLESLNRDLQYWSDQADSLSGQVKKLKNRKRDVEEVKRNLSAVSSSGSRDVNSQMSKCRRNLSDGISYSGKDARLAEIFDVGKEEKKVDQDGFLSQADDALDRELSRLARELDSADRALKNAQSTVRSTRNAITKERLGNLFQKGK